MSAAPEERGEDGITSINITPLVDVFLVLLILVMITSSLLDNNDKSDNSDHRDHREISMSVPQASQAGEKAPKTSGLAMDLERRIYLDGKEADSAAVAAALRSKVAADPAYQVLIVADKGLFYEDVIRLLDWVQGAGVRKYALKVAWAEG
jgi:biopolymer transport protein ExbD